MRLAAACRQGRARGGGRSGFRAATGALAVLFARSYERAEGIHRAMQARGFTGRFALLYSTRFEARDGVFLLVVSAFLVLVRVG
jgi:cobalt/nickel transport system permease protein